MRAAAALVIAAALGGCSAGDLAKGAAKAALGGGGPDLAANVQAGKTNAQVLGQARITEQKLVRPQARTIEQSTGGTGVRTEAVQSVTIERGAPWGAIYALVALCFLFWALPTPAQIGAGLAGLLSRLKFWRDRHADA